MSKPWSQPCYLGLLSDRAVRERQALEWAGLRHIRKTLIMV